MGSYRDGVLEGWAPDSTGVTWMLSSNSLWLMEVSILHPAEGSADDA